MIAGESVVVSLFPSTRVLIQMKSLYLLWGWWPLALLHAGMMTKRLGYSNALFHGFPALTHPLGCSQATLTGPQSLWYMKITTTVDSFCQNEGISRRRSCITKAQRDIRRKLRILTYAKEIGNISKACRYFGISWQGFYKWEKAYAVHGEKGLINSKPCPENPCLRIPPETVRIAKILPNSLLNW